MKDNKNIERLLLQQQWEASFFQIVEQYSERLLLCAQNIVGDQATAEDALQEAFIKIWKNLHNFRGDSKPYTWCYTVVRNCALNELRINKRQPLSGMDSEVLELLAGASSDSLAWDAQEISNQLNVALETLPEKQKMVFEMRYFQNIHFSELSSLTGISEGGLKANFHHAKRKVEEQLIHQLNLAPSKTSKN